MPALAAPELVALLRSVQAQLGAELLPVVRLGRDELAWDTLPAGSCKLPGVRFGQVLEDLRFPTETAEGLHLQRYADEHVEAHLDQRDACRDLAGHAAHDTQAFRMGAFGAMTGWRFAGPAGAIVGGLLGLAAGGQQPSRTRVVLTLEQLRALAR